MKFRLKIGKTGSFTDYTATLIQQDFTISNNMEHFIDTFEFSLFDEDGDDVDTFKNGQDVLIEEFSDATNVLYGGIIVEIEKEPIGPNIIHHITCQDYTVLLHKTTFVLQRALITDKDLIAAAFAAANGGDGLSEIDSATNVEEGRLFDFMDFPGTTLAALMDIVSQATGFIWYVDFEKNLHYHRYAKEVSTLNFTDVVADITATKVPYYDFSYSRTIGEFNAVEIRGTQRLSTNTNQEYKGDASTVRFNLDIHTGPGAITGNVYQPLTREPDYNRDNSLIDIYVNAGSDLDGAINDSVTTITVDDGTKYTVTDVILIDSERILVNSVSVNDLTVTRGHLESTAASHSDNAEVLIQQKVTVVDANRTNSQLFTDEATVDVIWDPVYLTVEFRTAPPNLATDSWRVIGRHASPAIARARDAAAIERVNGRIFEHIMNEPLIRSEEQALDIAKAFLRTQGPKERISLTTETDGLEVCQLTQVSNAKLGLIARQFLVTSLTYRILGGEVVEYSASLERNSAIFELLAGS